MAGRVILLNGTSSAGKTTIARLLQEMLEPRWLFLGFDEFVGMLTDVTRAAPAGPDAGPGADDDLARWLSETWYRAVAALAAGGFDVLVEDVILDSNRLGAAARLLAPFDVTFVAVRCAKDVAVQRERDRGDRHVGLVEGQFDLVHRGRTYDIEVDTSTQSPGACAEEVRRALEQTGDRVFEEQRASHHAEPI